jgi:hypothetical protein
MLLNSSMEWVLGFREVVSEVSLMMLKSSRRIHGTSWRQATIRSSVRKSFLRVLDVGPYAFVIINWRLRLLVRRVVFK